MKHVKERKKDLAKIKRTKATTNSCSNTTISNDNGETKTINLKQRDRYTET